MTTKTKIYIGVSVVALIGGYFIYKALKPKKPIVLDKNGNVVPTTSSTTPSTSTTTDNSECKKYVVGNVINFVNVRSTPSTSLKEISTLKKGSTVSAKPSSTSGWMELCDMQGFVSSKFLTPENSTSSNTTSTPIDQNRCLKKLESLINCSKDGELCEQKYLDTKNNKVFRREVWTIKVAKDFGTWYSDADYSILNDNNKPLAKELETLYQAKKFC